MKPHFELNLISDNMNCTKSLKALRNLNLTQSTYYTHVRQVKKVDIRTSQLRRSILILINKYIPSKWGGKQGGMKNKILILALNNSFANFATGNL